MQLTKSQSNVIDILIEQYKKCKVKNKKCVINFSAPTGSGKTFMSAHFISNVFMQENAGNKTMVVLATISNAELPETFARKLEEYKKYLNFKDFDVEFRESPSNSKAVKNEQTKSFELENNKVLIFGTSSFGRKKIFTEEGILDSFITEAKNKNWNIIYIRDESHKGGFTTSETGEKFYEKFDNLMVELSNFSIQMTATPKGRNDLVELKEEDLIKDDVSLVKTQLVYNDFKKDTFNSITLIEECLKKFKEVQEEYKKLDNFIRPALLIQVDSKHKNITQEEYNNTIEEIIKIVGKEFKYLKYFSSDIEGNAKEDLTLESASKHDSNYDVIIFKVGPATGWDIPRACMLLQIREVSSKILHQQTIGRIKRNPIQGLSINTITNKYYIYSNYQESTREIASYKLKDKFIDLQLYKGSLLLKNDTKKLIEEKYYDYLVEYFKTSAISSFLEENSKKTKLPIEKIKFHNKNETNNIYYVEVFSIFRLKIWIDSEIQKNKKYFTSGMNKIINDLQIKTGISKEIIQYTILIQYLTKIKEKYNEAYENYRNDELYKIIPNQKLEKNYNIWISSNELNKFDITDLEKYGYTLRTNINLNQKIEQKKDFQFLDSSPERHFMTEILEVIKNKKYGSEINFFAKMPTLPSNIYFEYLKKEDNEKHKAFIDFAIVSTNDDVLMVEVKGWNDYDEKKTEDLLYAFSEYKKQNIDIKINLLICYSGEIKNGPLKKAECKFLKNGVTQAFSVEKMIDLFFNNSL